MPSQFLFYPFYTPTATRDSSVLTNIGILAIADICKRRHRSVHIVGTNRGNHGLQVLGLAYHLDGGRVTVLAGGRKKTGRGRSDSELSKREKSRGKNGASEHIY